MVDQVKLVIQAERLPSVMLAQMLTDLDRSFRAFARIQGGRSVKVELAVSAVRYGSIEILLGALDGLSKLNDAREYLAPFASHLAQLVELATGAKLHDLVPQINGTDRKTVKSLAAPVANGHAQQVNIVNNGTMVFNIDEKVAKAVMELFSTPRELAPQVTNTIPAMPAIALSEPQIADLEQGKLMGTVFYVDRTWYARLLDGQGVLVPISASPETLGGLSEGALCVFRGRPLLGRRGETIGIALDEAIVTGTNS